MNLKLQPHHPKKRINMGYNNNTSYSTPNWIARQQQYLQNKICAKVIARNEQLLGIELPQATRNE